MGSTSTASKPSGVRLSWARWVSVAGLLIIAAASTAVAIWAATGAPASGTVRFELAKTAMQVVAVAFLGGLATIATFTFQHNRMQEAAELARIRAKRERQDELINSLLRETVTAYNQAKRVRRLLRAETGSDDGRVTLDLYDRHLVQILDIQLEFEKFERCTPFVGDDRLRSLTGSYEKIENYLNDGVDEYQTTRHKVAADPAGLPRRNLPWLTGFAHQAFVGGVSKQLDKIIDLLQVAVLQPLPPHDRDRQPK